MGDPKRQRKKFSKPGHPWEKERIDIEKQLLKQYGLRRKYEVWKMDSMLKKFLNRAKMIIGQKSPQSESEKNQMLDRLCSLGLLRKGSKVEDVLNLKLKDILERRLQTLVYRKQMARSMLQARQFIVHEHVIVRARKITSPSYLVSIDEEHNIKLAGVILQSPEKKLENLENKGS